MNLMTRPTPLCAAVLAAHAALVTWQEYRRSRDARLDRKSARRIRCLAAQLDRIEDRVNELSSDRTQAAAAVTRLFAVKEGGESWEGQDARHSR